MHLDLAVGDRDFGHVSGVTAKSKVHGDSAAHAFGQRFAPSRFLRREVEHAQIPRLFQQQIAPELVGIFFREPASSSMKHSTANAVWECPTERSHCTGTLTSTP